MKRVLSIFAIVAMFTTLSFSQWSFVKNFPNDVQSKMNTGNHGIQVSPDGNVWYLSYGAGDTIPGVSTLVRTFRVYSAAGVQASFSPIRMLTVNKVTDTLWNSGRGMGVDYDGNIYLGTYDSYYKINYKTGAGMLKLTPVAVNSVVSPGVDGEGNIYTSCVAPGFPAMEFGSDGSFIGNDVDTVKEYGRTMEVTKDGLALYLPRYSALAILRYTRPDKFSAFTFKDTVLKGSACESMNWDAKTGYLWCDAGSYTDVPTDTIKFHPNRWYGYQIGANNGALVKKDSISWNFTTPYSPDERPRGIAFSPDGVYAYVGCFGASSYAAVEQFKRGAVDVRRDGNAVVSSFTLSQNYPNPFNPTTEISFSVPKEGFVSLKVFNILGQEVATLIDRQLSAGSYTTNFDASRLSSGTYIYQISANGFSASKKMLLMK